MSSPTSRPSMAPPSPQDTPTSDRVERLPPPASTAAATSTSTSSLRPNGQKEKRDPSITPRRFRKLFQPRSHGSMGMTSARRALYDITQPANNRSETQSSPLRPFPSINAQDPPLFPRGLKRRKTHHRESFLEDGDSNTKIHRPALAQDEVEEDACDILSSPCGRALQKAEAQIQEEIEEEPEDCEEILGVEPPKPIVRFRDRGLAARLMHMSIGNSGPRKTRIEYPVHDYQDETASFYSKPEDVHISMSLVGGRRAIPFCVVGLHTNSLVAIGDDEGRVRLLESEKSSNPPFRQAFVGFQAHKNAIIDMTFSEDDTLLATASGDQSAKVTDMTTQTTRSVLQKHHATVKQVRFQPGQNNKSVLATSSRDGHVHIWDMRCKGSDGPVMDIHQPFGRSATNCGLVNSFWDAHDPTSRHFQPSNNPEKVYNEIGRQKEISVTTIQFLPSGQENFLLSASEIDSCVKLWDIRSLRVKDTSAAQYSCTRPVESHVQHRHYGITSLVLSPDGSRFYTVCKDNTVYAYSTSHLVLGNGPGLDGISQGRKTSASSVQEGLGPIYGFRHPRIHVSFYVKSAIRKAQNGKCEMLAVGSGDGCALLFPTDERYHPKSQRSSFGHGVNESATSTIGTRASQRRRRAPEEEDMIPISRNGTALVGGHEKEVSSLSFTSEGELVTVDDEYIVRCWREGPEAKALRAGGQREGARLRFGWADVDEKYDDEEV